MKRTTRYLVLGAIFYLAFLVVGAPSAWMAQGLKHFSQGRLGLAQTSGSLWRGQGELFIAFNSKEDRRLGRIEWRIEPWWLLLGRVQTRLQISAPDADLRGAVGLAFRKIAVRELSATLPADLAVAFYSPAMLFGAQGRVQIKSEELEFGGDGVRGGAEILWQGAGSRLSSVSPLGDYRLSFAGQGKLAQIKLETVRGDLMLGGEGQWRPESGALQFNGSARPAAHAQELEPLLRVLGPDQGGGQRSISVNLRLAAAATR